MEKLDAFCKWFIVILLSVAAGYFWAYKVYSSYESQAEKDLNALEEQFHKSLEKPHSFHIFNSQFEVYPINVKHKKFHYRRKS